MAPISSLAIGCRTYSHSPACRCDVALVLVESILSTDAPTRVISRFPRGNPATLAIEEALGLVACFMHHFVQKEAVYLNFSSHESVDTFQHLKDAIHVQAGAADTTEPEHDWSSSSELTVL